MYYYGNSVSEKTKINILTEEVYTLFLQKKGLFHVYRLAIDAKTR